MGVQDRLVRIIAVSFCRKFLIVEIFVVKIVIFTLKLIKVRLVTKTINFSLITIKN